MSITNCPPFDVSKSASSLVLESYLDTEFYLSYRSDLWFWMQGEYKFEIYNTCIMFLFLPYDMRDEYRFGKCLCPTYTSAYKCTICSNFCSIQQTALIVKIVTELKQRADNWGWMVRMWQMAWLVKIAVSCEHVQLSMFWSQL